MSRFLVDIRTGIVDIEHPVASECRDLFWLGVDMIDTLRGMPFKRPLRRDVFSMLLSVVRKKVESELNRPMHVYDTRSSIA